MLYWSISITSQVGSNIKLIKKVFHILPLLKRLDIVGTSVETSDGKNVWNLLIIYRYNGKNT